MKKLALVFVMVMLLFAFKGSKNTYNGDVSKVEIKHLLEDSLLNVRALELIKEAGFFAFLTSSGNMGVGPIKIEEQEDYKVYYPAKLSSDTLKLNFRALAARKKHGFGITIGNPAYVIKLDKDVKDSSIAYKEVHEKVFYDSMEFWNDDEGIAIGDPTEDCMSIIITRDGGKTWTKLSCDDLPKAKEGEAAFAASDTNIAIVGNHTWVATGGKTSRILYSPNKGKTWEVFETPIIQGKETTGMYSLDFYDELNGFAIGGDYTQPDDNAANKIRTNDGGKTWHLVGENQSPGYRSCVKYMPNSSGKELVAVGFKGIDYSNDSGETWKHLSDEGFYTIRFLNDSIAYAAGAGRVSKLTFKK
ncbi:WD40/YVTN/BNR-like repeat-containing protein [Seonamhaeicola marinus]|uniref:Oxidoreductase n=1 Tax=Seonamhaeicola marinus TaxID=1912246 RepID=A0A5D0J9L4_9FLAO|nr:oxidoreductase [Seonamhaeicola marinus]TYA92269.1 oxidoreductase [Seonamhaeicola marinus]